MNPITPSPVLSGAGLGLRRALLNELEHCTRADISFMEVAPENWIHVGGRLGRQLRACTERFPFVCHGLSLSIGSPDPLDMRLLTDIKAFLREHQILHYTEHLSYCSAGGHLYDLMPIPFTEAAVHHVAARVRQVQDFLGQAIALENVSYYCPTAQELTELEFINAVVAESGCNLLLDVNNIYVNSINHHYDARDFLRGLPGAKTVYMHVAGHYDAAADLKIDTHGADVIDPVWALLSDAYQLFGVRPTLLERDFNLPPLPQLLREVERVRQCQALAAERLAQPAVSGALPSGKVPVASRDV
jgi:uncharacterized protein (UPF0276 family)